MIVSLACCIRSANLLNSNYNKNGNMGKIDEVDEGRTSDASNSLDNKLHLLTN